MTNIAVVFQSERDIRRFLLRRYSRASGKSRAFPIKCEISGKDVREGRFKNPALMEALDSSDGIIFAALLTWEAA